MSSLESDYFLEIGGVSGADLQFCVILAFCETLSSTVDTRPGVPIVVCPESNSSSSLCSACVLCGAHMLLYDQVGLIVVVSTLSATMSDISTCGCEAVDATILDCWTALHRARDLRWIGVPCHGTEPTLYMLDIELASHYALAANGGLRVLVPGKLLLAPSPAPLPAGQE